MKLIENIRGNGTEAQRALREATEVAFSLCILDLCLSTDVAILSKRIGKYFFEVKFVWQIE
jgi:hypothetical protein